MKRGKLVAAGTFLVLFAGTVYLSYRLPLLDALGPGPGFFPLILALLGLVLTALMIAGLAREPGGTAVDPGESEDFLPDRSAIFRIVSIVVVLLAAFAALDPLGYRLTAFLFISILLVVLGVRNYLAIGIVALVLSFGVFHSFYYWLKVPLPIGRFGF